MFYKILWLLNRFKRSFIVYTYESKCSSWFGPCMCKEMYVICWLEPMEDMSTCTSVQISLMNILHVIAYHFINLALLYLGWKFPSIEWVQFYDSMTLWFYYFDILTLLLQILFICFPVLRLGDWKSASEMVKYMEPSALVSLGQSNHLLRFLGRSGNIEAMMKVIIHIWHFYNCFSAYFTFAATKYWLSD